MKLLSKEEKNVKNLNNNYTVYCHISPNNKYYIGITQQTTKKRWQSNGVGYKNSQYFWRAIQKYGWDNFKHIILFENLNEFIAKETEKYLINKYKTSNSDFGYNISLGGDGTYGYHHSEETKEKLRISSSKSKHSEETKRLISKISSKKVVQLSKVDGGLINTFNSIVVAGKETNISSKHISRCCTGKRKSSGGFCWMHYDDYVENGFNKDLLQNSSYRKVLCIETNEIFNTILEASISKNINNVGIWNCCNNLAKTAGGFIWKYAD